MLEPEKPPARRWRPRFSLRTLLIGVLLIALSWTATVVWGVPEIEAQVHTKYRYGPFNPPEIVRTDAVAPFIVSTHFVRQPVLAATSDSKETGSETQTWFWFFGYTKRLIPKERYLDYDFKTNP